MIVFSQSILFYFFEIFYFFLKKKILKRPIPLLPAACELAFHTVNVSALNAEELRRENGIELVSRAFSRCMDVISSKATPQDTSVQVCFFFFFSFLFFYFFSFFSFFSFSFSLDNVKTSLF